MGVVKGNANVVNERARLGTSVRFVSREGVKPSAKTWPHFAMSDLSDRSTRWCILFTCWIFLSIITTVISASSRDISAQSVIRLIPLNSETVRRFSSFTNEIEHDRICEIDRCEISDVKLPELLNLMEIFPRNAFLRDVSQGSRRSSEVASRLLWIRS